VRKPAVVETSHLASACWNYSDERSLSKESQRTTGEVSMEKQACSGLIPFSGSHRREGQV